MTKRLPLHSGISVFNSKFILMLSLPFCSYLTFWGGNEVKRAKRYPVLVLNAEGEKLRPKQMDKTTTCEFQKW
jgi:hypothetical protein